jgi:16S rRNA (adenine1518-N6/adenine1519-N6)-dimethyltransferase
VVSNLPYSVASPLLVELAQMPHRPQCLVVTLQLEVVQRLVAKPATADYGVLTLLMQLDYEPVEWFKIPASCFFPAPNVDSACIHLRRRPTPLVADQERKSFVLLVKLGFSQRRKMLFKLLKQNWPADKLAAAFAARQISPQIRAEKLSLAQFIGLLRQLLP